MYVCVRVLLTLNKRISALSSAQGTAAVFKVRTDSHKILCCRSLNMKSNCVNMMRLSVSVEDTVCSHEVTLVVKFITDRSLEIVYEKKETLATFIVFICSFTNDISSKKYSNLGLNTFVN